MRVTSTTIQALINALDVAAYVKLNLLLGCIEYTGSGSIVVEIWTGMQRESEDGWVQLGAFSAKSTSNTWELKDFAGMLRYVCWKVTAMGGTSATFTITGLGLEHS